MALRKRELRRRAFACRIRSNVVARADAEGRLTADNASAVSGPRSTVNRSIAPEKDAISGRFLITM
jgi:hypothetical protein